MKTSHRAVLIGWNSPIDEKYVSDEGVFFDFKTEFKVAEGLRLVIHDQRKKEFIIIEELDDGENLFIKRNALPEHLDCKFKLQQFREDRWYDASRYIQLTNKVGRRGMNMSIIDETLSKWDEKTSKIMAGIVQLRLS